MKYAILFLVSLILAACGAGKEEAPGQLPERAAAPPPAPAKSVRPEDSKRAKQERELLVLKKEQELRTGPAAGSGPRASAPESKKPMLDMIAGQLSRAATVFTVPEQANVQDNIRAELLIDPSKTTEELANLAGVAGRQLREDVPISKVVVARLTAADIKVTPETPEKQAISQFEPTTWRWILEPSSTGRHELHLSISAVITVENERVDRHIKTLDRIIVIEITPGQVVLGWLGKNWQWLWGAVLVPIALWFWRRRKK